MKSPYLLVFFLSSLVSVSCLGQAKSTAPISKTSFDRFYERLSIGYSATYTSPNLKDWDTRHAAISPEYGDLVGACDNCDSYSQNIFNQVNIGYNFGAKMKFNIIPRATLFLSHPVDNGKSDQAMITIEDTLVGFSGTIYKSDDGKFSWWMRPALRLATSHASRTANNRTFGTTTHQPDWNNTFTYTLNTNWEFGLAWINRMWVYDDRYNNSRHRMITVPSITYSISDKTQLQLMYEHFLENLRNYESLSGKQPNYRDWWQNLMFGVNQTLTEKASINPYIGAYINDVPFSTESTFFGISFAYSIK